MEDSLYSPPLSAPLIWADVLSRALFAPEEVPIGVLTSIVGAPIFLWIVTHRYGEVQP